MDSQFDVASMKLLTVELGLQVNFLSSQPLRVSLGGWEWLKREQLDQGYKLVVSAVDSTIVFIFRSPRLSGFQWLVQRSSFEQGVCWQC